MNEQSSFERLVADQLGNAGVGTPPPSAIEDTIARAGRTRRDPRWLALLKEPPMRTNSQLSVGSPTVRVAAVMLATLLLAVALAAAGVAGQRLLAATNTLVVDASGAGDYITITEAVAAASDGDTIVVRPGRYAESVVIDGKDLAIKGEGERDEIVVEATLSDLPPALSDLSPAFEDEASEPYPFAIVLSDTDTQLSSVSVLGQQDGTAITVVGADAALALDDMAVRVELPERTEGYVGESVVWLDGSGGTLSGSVVEGTIGLYGAQDVTIAGNDMPASCIQIWEATGIEIRTNTLHGCIYEMGIDVDESSEVLIEGNDIMVEDVIVPPDFWRSDGRIGIHAGGDSIVTIRDNDIHDSRSAIQVKGGEHTLEITANRIQDNDMGIARVVGSTVLSGNTISGSAQIGVEIRDGAPSLEGNTITDNVVGLSVVGEAVPALSGNTICDNGTNLRLPDGGDALDTVDNEICPDDA